MPKTCEDTMQNNTNKYVNPDKIMNNNTNKNVNHNKHNFKMIQIST